MASILYTVNPAEIFGFNANMIPGLKVWIDASQESVSEDQFLTQLTDFSGNENHAIEAGAADNYRAQYKTEIFGSKPGLKFTDAGAGGYSYYELGNLSVQFPSEASLVCVVDLDEASDSGYCIYENWASVVDGPDSWWRYSSGDSYPGMFRDTRLTTPFTMPNTGKHIFSMRSTATNWAFRIDGVEVYSGAGDYQAGELHRIGLGDSTAKVFNGYIGELAVYNTGLTNQQFIELETSLQSKWEL